MAESTWIDRYSRWRGVDVYDDGEGNLFLEEREPLESPAKEFYREHIAVGSDTPYSLAGYYYKGLLPRAASYWWAIAEANGIVDATQPITAGKILKIPDYQYVLRWQAERHEVYV